LLETSSTYQGRHLLEKGKDWQTERVCVKVDNGSNKRMEEATREWKTHCKGLCGVWISAGGVRTDPKYRQGAFEKI
jgi:hypothetical protein